MKKNLTLIKYKLTEKIMLFKLLILATAPTGRQADAHYVLQQKILWEPPPGQSTITCFWIRALSKLRE